MRLSVLDLSPVPSGATAAEALRNTLDLARHADRLGYHRYWLAEHHNTGLIASSSPEVMIGHVAQVTERLRVGSGGVMLPNHAPLKVAETFRTLEALHPGRIDLGLGRAPGTDARTALALRRSQFPITADDFPQQLSDLLGFLTDALPEGHPFQTVQAAPEEVSPPELWLLGSSDFSARMAAERGLGFAFAHHIDPWPAVPALRLYHQGFRPSRYLSAPQSLMGVHVICAETDEAAEALAASADLTLLRFRQGKFAGKVPSAAEALAYPYTDVEREAVTFNRQRLTVGSPETVRRRLTELAAETGVSELMVTSLIHDHAARKQSYALLAEAFGPART